MRRKLENYRAMSAGRIKQRDDERLDNSTTATRRLHWVWLPGVLFGLMPLAMTSLAPAQDKAQAEEEELAIDEGFNVAESHFDQWLFGSQSSDHGLKRIESLLSLKVAAINRVCDLTEDQVAKLELAGQGDIKRFSDDVAVVRAKFMKVRRNRNAINNIFQEIQPLQARLHAGLFEQTSFFQKVLKRLLTDEQSSRYEQADWERTQYRYNAKLSLVVTMMERTMPLRAEQREQFIQVLKEETKPPKAFGQYDYYFVLYQLAEIPDQKLKPIFDEAQWKVLKQFAAQGQAMEASLKQHKVLP
ncbi:MAG TPA: hypothetical protein VMM76_10905 [Pirellulaceae bacterium]|nr:hypothetical protein [Pirellulaceae bacterium]